MPVYCFKCDKCGRREEEQRVMADSDKPMACGCGVDMRRDIQAEAPNRLAACDTYPMVSYAAGGHVDDTQKMMQEDKRLGIRETHYEDGDPVFRSKKHRKEYCEKREMYDRNAADSDPTPKHTTSIPKRRLRRAM